VPLTAKDVAEITRLLEESDFLELRLEHEGFKLTLKRAGAPRSGTDSATAAPAAAASHAAAAAVPAAGVVPAAAVPASWSEPGSSGSRPPGSATDDPSLIDVTAPLLGIFHRAPRPGAAPYVEVGSVLEEDTVIGIIEVMKLMNSVRAEVRGTVVEILVADGSAVEQGQVLLRVARESAGG
jgi:acetyl-CoA carboxylase biotin carboxyl carrier protein